MEYHGTLVTKHLKTMVIMTYDMPLLQNLTSLLQQGKSIQQLVLRAFAHHCSHTPIIFRGTFVAESSLVSLIEISRRFVFAMC